MATKVSTDKVITEANDILTVWKDNPTVQLGDLTLAQYTAKIENLDQQDKAIAAEDLKLSKQRNTRDDAALAINSLNSRFRSVVRGQFGPDSSEYEQVGGTRSSERKPNRRKTTKETVTK